MKPANLSARVVVSALLGPAIGVFLVHQLGDAMGLQQGPILWAIGATAFGLIAFLVSRRAGSASWLTVPIALGGIVLGVAFDAAFTEGVLHRSRNLWPFDAVFWCWVGVVPLCLGFGLGKRGNPR